MHGKKEKTNEYKEKIERPVLNPKLQFVIANMYTEKEISFLCCCGDIFYKKCGEEKKINKCKAALIGDGPISILRYNKSLSFHTINMMSLFCIVVKKSFTKNTKVTAWRESRVNMYSTEETGEDWVMSQYTTCHCKIVHQI